MLRIVNETGVAHDTRVYGKDGEDVTKMMHIKAIDITATAGEIIEASLTFSLPRFDTWANDVKWYLSDGTECAVSTITFADGSSVDLSTGTPVWSNVPAGDVS